MWRFSYTIAEEDVEYEEGYMDDDLEFQPSSEAADSSLSGLLTDLSLQPSGSAATSAGGAAAHDSIDDSPSLSLSGHSGYDSDSD